MLSDTYKDLSGELRNFGRKNRITLNYPLAKTMGKQLMLAALEVLKSVIVSGNLKMVGLCKEKISD